MAAEIKKLLGCANIGQLAKHIVEAQAMSSFGTSGNYSCAVEDIKFFVKIALYTFLSYDLWKKPGGSKSPVVDAEINIFRAIKTKIIDRGYSPHFIEILAISRCTGVRDFILDKEKCTQMLLGHANNDKRPQSLLCAFASYLDTGMAQDQFAIIFSEFCEFNIKEYIMRYAPLFPSERDLMIQAIIFQIYYTLEVAQRVWPRFRHGDLYVHNIMIKLAHDGAKYLNHRHYLRYKMDNREWNIPFFGFFVKIIDFGHSEIPEEGVISSVRKPSDLWLPDHATFIMSFEGIIIESLFMTDELRAFFGTLNYQHLLPGVAHIYVMRLLKSFATPISAIQTNFGAFETAINEELVIKEYTAPPKRND
jgi:hypothetical protein